MRTTPAHDRATTTDEPAAVDDAVPAHEDTVAHYVISGVVGLLAAGLLIGGLRGGLTSSRGLLGPGAFPAALGAILAVLAIALAVATRRRAPSTRTTRDESFGYTRRTLLVDLGLLLAYVLTLPFLGYVIGTLAYMLVMLTVVRSGRRWTRVVLAVVFVVGTYLLFDRLLQVTLPVSVIPGLVI
jgi:putative tricarboxylic transport membrane protein